MWTRLLEWCAESLGATEGASGLSPAELRRRRLLFVTLALALGALGIALNAWYGFRGFLPCAVLLWIAIAAKRAILIQREKLWNAARLGLDEPGQRPGGRLDPLLLPPTARALHHVAVAVDSVRRGAYAVALARLGLVERGLLRPDELRLLDAARAMLSLALGDPGRAAGQAVLALPTGSEALDAQLGRVVIAQAWSVPSRLMAIETAWIERGASPGTTLGRLVRLARLRIDPDALETVAPLEARVLSEDARAVGDDDLAVQLDARGRTTLYR